MRIEELYGAASAKTLPGWGKAGLAGVGWGFEDARAFGNLQKKGGDVDVRTV